MKFVHLSDLHIGKKVNGFSMLEDQEDVLFKKILPIIDAENPDFIIIAGDVYDKSIPPAEAVGLFDEFLVKLAKRNLQVFIISGNHDSPERLAFGNRLIDKSGIHISPVYQKNTAKFALKDDFGTVNIYMLPFIKPIHVRTVFENDENISYTDAVRMAVSQMDINISERNILITPFFNISLFAPRWKKLIGFTTEIALEMLLLAVFLTNDEKATDENLVLLVQYSVYTVLITDAFMHFFAIFLQVSDKQKRRLLKIILLKGQLIVLKEYEDMQCINTFITVIGLSIGLVIWGFSFYMSFTFYSVWKVQNRAFIDSFFITIVIDFFVLEFIYELFLSIIYTQRKSSELFKRLGEFLNRVRNHRCMS